MRNSISIYLFFIVVLSSACGQSQSEENSARLVGGPCEGCEGVLEYNEVNLSSVDTLPGFSGKGSKIKISGIIYKQDAKTPAQDVILYVYHTDVDGLYSTKGTETGLGKRHGYNRGWIKTDKNGHYSFYTIKPGSYPDGTLPAHIHPTILEPNGKYYWLEDYYFEDDSLLTSKEISPKAPRGGSMGVMSLTKKGELWVGKRDFILGSNISNYE